MAAGKGRKVAQEAVPPLPPEGPHPRLVVLGEGEVVGEALPKGQGLGPGGHLRGIGGMGTR